VVKNRPGIVFGCGSGVDLGVRNSVRSIVSYNGSLGVGSGADCGVGLSVSYGWVSCRLAYGLSGREWVDVSSGAWVPGSSSASA
jgi:hypothetical protein